MEMMSQTERHLKSLHEGCTIKVVRGRTVRKGTIAKVIRMYREADYTTLYLDNGMKTYAYNVLIEYKGAFIKPIE